MKTKLNIADPLMQKLRAKAVEGNRTISELVEEAICLWLQTTTAPSKFKPLPTFRSGGHLVDVANRDMLYGVMETM